MAGNRGPAGAGRMRQETMRRGSRPRVRATLLVLLWLWAGAIALVLDLFLNVPEFDRVRPRAQAYLGARYVAHRMVGEPISEDELGVRAGVIARGSRAPRGPAPLPGHVRRGSRHPGGRPDLRTPQGARLYEGLRRAATGAAEEAQREGAIRSLAAMFGADAGPALLQVAADAAQPAQVRDLAQQLAERQPLLPGGGPGGPR